MNGSPSAPRVSVLIPTFNQEQYIEQCVRSVLDQDYSNLEVVVGNDRSTDATGNIASRFASDTRLTVVTHGENLGRVANYHSLLYRHATGEWVINLDGDDYFLAPDALSQLVAAATTSEATVLAFGRVIRVVNDEEPQLTQPGDPPFTGQSASHATAAFDGNELVANYWKDDRGLKHAGALYRRQTARDVGFYRHDILSTDIDSLLRLALHGRVVRVDVPVAAWRIHGTNASGSRDIESRIVNLVLVDSVADEFERIAPSRASRGWRWKMKRRMVYGTVVSFLRSGHRDRLGPYLKRAFPCWWQRFRFFLYPRFLFRMVRGK